MLAAVLVYEEKVQLEDKSRLDASKCFAATGTTAITTLTIKPEDSTTAAISVFNSTVDARYLDWVYTDTKWDIDSTNNKIYFNEGGSNLTATITAASYTRAALLTEIQTQMTAAGGTYTVSESQGKITIGAIAQFKLLPLIEGANLLPHLGFFDTTEMSLEQVSAKFEYCIKRVTVAVGNGTETTTKYFYVKVHSVEGDALYSSDKDIMSYDTEIMKYAPKGRASFIDVHRTAQSNILDWLDQNGYRDNSAKRYRKFDILDKEEVKNWSKFMVLKMIYFRLHNQVDDVYKKKSDYFEKLEISARSRFTLSLDKDKDGEKDVFEEENTWNGRIYLR